MTYTVYVLQLLWIDAVYVGQTKDFSRRLFEHIIGQGAVVTEEFGVNKIIYTEEVSGDRHAAKQREHQVREGFLAKGWAAYGANHLFVARNDALHLESDLSRAFLFQKPETWTADKLQARRRRINEERGHHEPASLASKLLASLKPGAR